MIDGAIEPPDHDAYLTLRQFIEGAERTHKLQQRALTALQEAMCMLSEFDHRTVLRGEDKAQMLRVIQDLNAARSAEQKGKTTGGHPGPTSGESPGPPTKG